MHKKKIKANLPDTHPQKQLAMIVQQPNPNFHEDKEHFYKTMGHMHEEKEVKNVELAP